MRRAGRVLVVAGVVALGAGARADFASDGARIDQTRDQVDQLVRQTAALKDDAIRLGQAIRASCIDEKLKALRGYARAIKAVRETWPSAEHNPKLQQRSLERVDQIIAGSTGYAADARACVEGREGAVQFNVKIEVSTDAPPSTLGGPPAPVAPFERPVKASPY